MESTSAPKRQRNKVDYNNVILALPAVFPSKRKKKNPHAAGEKGATTSQNTATGQRKNHKAAAPRDEPTEGHKDVLLDVPGAHDMKQQSDFAKKETDSVTNEHSIPEDYPGNMEQQNLANSEDILEDSSDLPKEANIVNKELDIPEEQSGIAPQQNLANAGADILAGDTAGFAEGPNAVKNEQNILEDQGGLMKQHNPVSAGEDTLAGDPGGVAEEPNAVNNEQNILEEHGAGMVLQQNLANAQGVQAEADPAAVDNDIFDFPLKNQLVDDFDYLLEDLDD